MGVCEEGGGDGTGRGGGGGGLQQRNDEDSRNIKCFFLFFPDLKGIKEAFSFIIHCHESKVSNLLIKSQ